MRVGRLKGAEGVIEYSVPQARGLEAWQSEIRAALCGKSEELEWLAAASPCATSKRRSRVVRTAAACSIARPASRVCEVLWADSQEYARRDLSGIEVAYLFIDGVAEPLHLGQPREAVLVAWAITMSGTKCS